MQEPTSRRRVDPFDMVGGGTREENYGWRDGKLISLEDDPYSPYTLEEQIEGRISGVSNGTGSSNPNQGASPNNTNPIDIVIASIDNQQSILILVGYGNPTIDHGGFIEGYDNFINFMFDAAKNIKVELMGYEILDPNTKEMKYFVLPWNENSQTESKSNLNGIPGYSRKNVTQQFHTHPVGVNIWGSRQDALYSNRWNLPVNIVSSKGTIWQVHIPPPLRVWRELITQYGTQIYP
jgi:hypothetical protein